MGYSWAREVYTPVWAVGLQRQFEPFSRRMLYRLALNDAESAASPRQCRQQRLYFFPLPQGQGSLRPTLGISRT